MQHGKHLEELRSAVGGLYLAFGRYRLRARVEGCPCCVSEADELLLHSRPLRELSASDLSRYAFKSLTTWGDEDDLRHFLPRLFELAAEDASAFSFSFGLETLFGKLRRARWQEWPTSEQAAIDKYLRAWWNASLARGIEADEALACEAGAYEACEIESPLCCIGCATDGVEPFLEAWIEPPDAASLRLLRAWLGSGQPLGSAFWPASARSRALAWLLEPSLSERLEAIFFAGDGPTQAAASGALDGLGLLRHAHYRERA